MKGFVWSLHGSVLTALVLWGYISIFDWGLSRYVEDQVEARAELREQDRKIREAEKAAAAHRAEALLEATKAQYESLGLSYPNVTPTGGG